jgi:hypothetical protein
VADLGVGGPVEAPVKYAAPWHECITGCLKSALCGPFYPLGPGKCPPVPFVNLPLKPPIVDVCKFLFFTIAMLLTNVHILMKLLGLYNLALRNPGAKYFWTSASKWTAPDNKFLWCPSGLHLLPTAVYARPQGGTDPVNCLLMMEVSYVGGVISSKYHDLPFGGERQAMCEEV